MLQRVVMVEDINLNLVVEEEGLVLIEAEEDEVEGMEKLSNGAERISSSQTVAQ